MSVLNIFLLVCCAILGIDSAPQLRRIGSSYYYISAAEASFVEAQFLCQQQNMELVAFNTEADFIQFNNTMTEWQIDNKISYWTGGLRLKNGLWHWTSNKARLVYSEWGISEPYTPSKTVVYCLGFGSFSSSPKQPRKWSAIQCTANLLYICENK